MGFKTIVILVVLIVVAVLHSNADRVRLYELKWKRHMKNYNLSFANSSEEDQYYDNYEKNVKYIQDWNANASNTFKLAENKLTHLSSDFIRSKILLPKRYNNRKVVGSAEAKTVGFFPPWFFDWIFPWDSATTTTKPPTTTQSTTVGGRGTTATSSSSGVNWSSLFSGVKDQGNCGSCYAFAAAGAVEAAYAIKYGKTVSLSEEYIIDCTYRISGTSNYGCDGGLSEYSLGWIKNNHPLYSTADYPYLSARDSGTKPTGTCHSVSSPTMTPISVSSYGTAGSATESSVAAYVKANGPVTAYVDASLSSFSYYSSGIYNDAKCSRDTTDHAVLIVGYGTDSSGNDYWIIRNSWGTSWGMNGYMYLARNKNGLCGIVTENYYAKVN